MPTLNYPIKLDDAYPCRGRDYSGAEVTFTDLLSEGDHVGPVEVGDEEEPAYVDGVVVRGDGGGLWVYAYEPDDPRRQKEGSADVG